MKSTFYPLFYEVNYNYAYHTPIILKDNILFHYFVLVI